MDHLALYATPVFVTQLTDEEVCAEATRALLTERERVPGIRASNHGGAWHSVPDLAGRPDPVWRRVVQEVISASRAAFDHVAARSGHDTRELPIDAGVQMWGMVLPTGGYATVHQHHEASWSVALYTDAGDGDAPTSGALTFVDPRQVPATCAGVPIFAPAFTIRPRTGMLVVFPGWLQHYVHTYTGSRPRVSLSANVVLERRRA